MQSRQFRPIIVACLMLLVVGLVWIFMNKPDLAAASVYLRIGQSQSWRGDVAATPVHGIAYGPFRPGQSPDQQIFPTLAEVQADMPLLKTVANGVRTFGCVQLETVITATAEVGLPLVQGIWLSEDTTANQAELNCAVNASATHPHIQSLVVGNETILTGTLTIPQLCQYLADAKTQSGLPVTTAEPWSVWVAHPELVQCVDYVSVNLYAYWDGIAVENAAIYTAQRYAQVSALADGKVVLLSEVGWPSAGAVVGAAQPGNAEQAHFAADFLAWAKSNRVSWYWFEGMDEPWKCEKGRPAVECHWGLYAADRTPKLAQRLFTGSIVWLPVLAKQPTPTPTITPTVTPTPTAMPTATPTPTPPTVSCTITQPVSNSTVTTTGNCIITVVGTVYGATAGSYLDFSVHTNDWYAQDPRVSSPSPSGTWQAWPIYLGGQYPHNYHTILARLHNSNGTVVATCQVSGIVRGNSCWTP